MRFALRRNGAFQMSIPMHPNFDRAIVDQAEPEAKGRYDACRQGRACLSKGCFGFCVSGCGEQKLILQKVYGPIAAFLVELFPTRIRYTSMSLLNHIGNGWFGGFLPLIAASIMVFTGDIHAGLLYPIAIALMSLTIGWIALPETKDLKIVDWAALAEGEPPGLRGG